MLLPLALQSILLCRRARRSLSFLTHLNAPKSIYAKRKQRYHHDCNIGHEEKYVCGRKQETIKQEKAGNNKKKTNLIAQILSLPKGIYKISIVLLLQGKKNIYTYPYIHAYIFLHCRNTYTIYNIYILDACTHTERETIIHQTLRITEASVPPYI